MPELDKLSVELKTAQVIMYYLTRECVEEARSLGYLSPVLIQEIINTAKSIIEECQFARNIDSTIEA